MENKKFEKLARLIVVQILLALIATVGFTTAGVWGFNMIIHGADKKQYVFPESGSLISIGTAIFIIYNFLFYKFIVKKGISK